MHFKWDCNWGMCCQDLTPRKKESYSFKKNKNCHGSFWLHSWRNIQKQSEISKASQILLSSGRKNVYSYEHGLHPGRLSRQWFIVWISPECELDILVKAVKSCLWRQDFPGCTEKNWFYWFLWLVLSDLTPLTTPIPGSLHLWNTNRAGEILSAEIFSKPQDFWLLSLCSWGCKDYVDHCCYS